MERYTAYSLGREWDKFLKKIVDEGFNYNPYTYEIRSAGVSHGILVRSPRHCFLVISNDLGNDSQVTKNERQRLRDLSDKFE